MAFKTAKMIFSAIPLAAGMVFLLFPFSHANEVGRHGSPAARFQSQTDSTPLTPLEKRLIREGLVNVRTLDPTIIVDLKYAREDNFMGKAVYGDFNRAYLRPAAARKLAKASEILRSRFRNLRILVGDALRPRSVQCKMWELVVNTPMQRYVANPATGSMHNYGAAVDVTLYDVMTGKRLDMGTPLDHFGPLAQPAMEARYLRSGKLTKTQVANRVILRNAMLNAGWRILRIEWWHFNAFPKHYVRKHYAIVE
jgi:D-alanyl-D-alanine dipeptidase